MNIRVLFLIGVVLWGSITYASADTWVSDPSIISGLNDVGVKSAPTVFLDGSTFKLISGENDGVFNGYYWSGSTWVSDPSIIYGLSDVGFGDSTSTVFNDSGTLKLISGEFLNGAFHGFYWNGSTWASDPSIVSGLSDVGSKSTPTVFLDGSTFKLISGENDGVFNGYYWSGSTWVSDPSIISGLNDVGFSSAPTVFLDGSTFKLISGENDGVFNGYYWSGSTWVSDPSIVSGLSDVGLESRPTVFLDGSTFKLISGEYDGVFNGWVLENSAPTIPTIIGEPDYHLNQSITVQWLNSTDIDGDSISYDIKVGTTPGGAEILNESVSANESSSFNINQFETYYWSVRSNDTYQLSNWSTEDSFTFTNSKPIIPTIIGEPDYHLNQSITVQWLNSTDIDGDSISYDIKVGTTTGNTDILNEVVSTNESSSFNINQFNTYYWSVRSNDTYEVSDWSTEDIFSVTNTAPSISNVTLSPDPTAVENDLTALNDTATDTDGDPITLYYKWYKNTILQSSLTTSTVGSSNTSNGELWKVGIIPNDGYENGTEVQSQTVEIGSSNSAPTLTGVNIDKSYPLKRYINFTITSENASDPNNDPRKLEVGSATGLSDLGIGDYFTNGNESNITIAMPFYDGNSHILYIRLNDSNLTSQEYTIIIESDTTLPVLNSESISPETGTQGIPFGITINTTSLNSTISTVTVNVARPDATSANWTLSNTVNDTWYYNYLSTADIGTYTVNYFTITDASDNVKTATSSLSFTITAAVVTGGGGGGGGGSGGTTIIQTGDVTDLTITPPRLDTYVLYGGFGEDRTLKYRFIANRNITSCLVDSKEEYNDIATCVVTDGYIVDIYLTINDSKGYSGTITVRDSDEFVATSDLIIRVLDIGAYIKIVNIPVGEAIASLLNPFFASANGVLIGIRIWGMGATVGLLGLALFKSDIFE